MLDYLAKMQEPLLTHISCVTVACMFMLKQLKMEHTGSWARRSKLGSSCICREAKPVVTSKGHARRHITAQGCIIAHKTAIQTKSFSATETMKDFNDKRSTIFHCTHLIHCENKPPPVVSHLKCCKHCRLWSLCRKNPRRPKVLGFLLIKLQTCITQLIASWVKHHVNLPRLTLMLLVRIHNKKLRTALMWEINVNLRYKIGHLASFLWQLQNGIIGV